MDTILETAGLVAIAAVVAAIVHLFVRGPKRAAAVTAVLCSLALPIASWMLVGYVDPFAVLGMLGALVLGWVVATVVIFVVDASAGRTSW